MAQRVLVLGGHGFIGKALVRELINQGHLVWAPTRQEVDITKGLENNYIDNIDVCFHLASTTHNYHILDDPTLDIETNCIGLVNVLDQFQLYNRACQHIYISTFFVNHGEPLGLYGATKLCAEHILKTYSRVYDMPCCILRLPNVYGPGEQGSAKKGSLNWMMERKVRGENLVFYGGDAWREFLYIDDAVQEILNCPNFSKNGQVFDIPGHPFLMGDFIREIDPLATETQMPDFHKRVGIKDYKSGWAFRGKIGPIEGIKRTKEYYETLHSV